MSTVLSPTTPASSSVTRSRRLRRVGIWTLVGAWVAVAFIHPNMDPDTISENLDGRMGRWIGVHVAQLFLAAGLATLLWHLVRGKTSRSARLVRGLLPLYLVTFGAFDSVVGLGAGLAVDSGPAGVDVARHIISSPIAGDFSLISNIASLSLIAVIASTGLALKRAGTSTLTWSLMIFGILLGAHSGAPAAVGAVAIGWSAHRAIARDGQ